MATIFARKPLTVAVAAGAVGTALYVSRPTPMRLDSSYREPSKTLSFPKTMLFSQQLRVKSNEQINHDTRKITFELPGGENEISGVPASSAILTQHTPAGAWFPVLRPYTPISEPSAVGTLQLLIKKYPDGRASSYMHSLSPGQSLTVRGPIPGYSYNSSPSQVRSVVLIAGGAGITPIYSLARHILEGNASDQTKIQLLWGVNGSRDIVLKEELETLEKNYPDRLSIVYTVSKPENTSAPLGGAEKYREGYVDKSLVLEAVARCGASWGDEKGTKVFLCGPPKMEDALAGKAGVFGQLGLGKKEIHRF